MNSLTCSKCNGSGYLQGFTHIKQGICFQCKGKGSLTLTDKEYHQYQAELANKQQIEDEYFNQMELLRHEEEKKRIEDEKRKEDNLQAFKEKQEYLGKINEKLTLKLKYKFMKHLKHGIQYVLQSESGNSVVFYSKKTYFVLGDNWEIEGVVKEHTEYDGYKQTVLKNAVVLNELNLDEMTDEEIDNLPI